jgi:hypothetical protein
MRQIQVAATSGGMAGLRFRPLQRNKSRGGQDIGHAQRRPGYIAQPPNYQPMSTMAYSLYRWRY